MGWLTSALASLGSPARPHRTTRKPRPRPALAVAVESLEGRQLLAHGLATISLASTVFPVSNVVTGADGNVWVAGIGGKDFGSTVIDRVTPGGAVTAFTVPGPVAIDWLAPGPDGNVWFSGDTGPPGGAASFGLVGKVTPAGQFSEYVVPIDLGAAATLEPSMITAAAGNALWFQFRDAGLQVIGRITTAGNFEAFPFRDGFLATDALAAAPDGSVWFADGLNDTVDRLTPAGALSAVPNTVGPAQAVNGLNGGMILVPDNREPFFAVPFWLNGSFGAAQLSPTGAITPYAIPGRLANAFENYLGAAGGSLWFTHHNQLARITSTGLVKTYSVSSLLGPGRHLLESITTGTDGNLYLLDEPRSVLVRIPPSRLPLPVPRPPARPRGSRF